jgi:hypothetical protein
MSSLINHLFSSTTDASPADAVNADGSVTPAPKGSGIFDTMDALSLILMWIIFGYLVVLLNCDLQRLLVNNPLFLHGMAILVVFFLMTTIDPNNKSANLFEIGLKTVFVYICFLLVTKSKWYFALPVIVVISIDQMIKRADAAKPVEDRITRNKIYHYGVRGVIVLLVTVGSIDYARLQKLEYKSQFTWFKFFFGLSNRCKDTKPLR